MEYSEDRKFGFGRIPSEFDPRDYDLRNFIPQGIQLLPKTSMIWDYPLVPLDQGNSGHCVGFGVANFGINLPVHIPYTNEDGHKFYYLCKEIDGNPGSEEGSTVRTAAKLLMNQGRINAYAFASDVDIVKYWILNQGPVMAGTIWTSGMLVPNSDNIISISGEIIGGHFYLLNEWRDDNYIGIQNSWGQYWGTNGKSYISAEDWKKLFLYNGEALAAVELENYEVRNSCFLEKWLTRNKFKKSI